MLSVIASCSVNQEVVYFQDAANFETLINDSAFDTKFKVDDLVSIHISTLDSEASAPFNLIKGAEEGGLRPEQIDYLIDKNGEIDFPVIGKVKLVGLSPSETRQLLREKLEKDYLINPIICLLYTSPSPRDRG